MGVAAITLSDCTTHLAIRRAYSCFNATVASVYLRLLTRSQVVKPSPRTAQILDLYQVYLKDQDTNRFTRLVSKRYSVGTLERLTRHEVREVRRAAVLALGILAGYDSNAVLGRSLIDEDRVVRTLAENGIRSLW